MTICIAAICESGRGLIMAADRQFGLGYTSVESKAGKLDNLGPDWYVAFSASHSPYATEVITLGRHHLVLHPERSHYDIIPKVVQAYREIRSSKIEALYLASWGTSLAEFHSHGKDRIPLSIYTDVYGKITSFDLGVDLLVAGFGDTAGIFRVKNPGISTEQTALGFWAIGSGHPAALSSLFSREFDFRMGVEEALLYVYEAKVDAEYAAGVGLETDIFVINRSGTALRIDAEGLKALEKIRKQLEPRKFRQAHKEQLAKMSEIEVFARMMNATSR